MTVVLEQRLNLASRKRRIAAFMIDHFFMTFLMVSVTFLALGPNFMEDNSMSSLTTTMLAVILPGFLLYFAKDSVNGKSIGMWILGIMVRDSTNPNLIPSLGRLLVRNLFIILWPIEFIVLATSNDKRRLGDKIANTVVLTDHEKAKKLPRVAALISIGFLFFIFMFLFVGTAMKSSDAYKTAIKGIEQNQEIVKEIGGIKGYGMSPSGSINITNGHGEAQLQIKVIGNEKDLDVEAYLTKEPDGGWKLIEMNK